MTLQERMALSRGHPGGFDYLRILLAISVVVWHTVVVSYGIAYQDQVWSSPARPLVALIIPMFFALSGYLVAGSLERCRTLTGFLSLRLLRLVPALAVEVVLSALVLGPLVTNLGLPDYFGDQGFAVYFLNILGDIHYMLPGVFAANPLPGIVNGQLWTVPYELECYAALAVLSLLGLHRRRAVFLGVVLVLQAAFAARAVFGAAAIETSVPPRLLVLCFLVGVALYLYRDRVAHSHALGLTSLIATFLAFSVPMGTYFVALPVTYLTVYLGTLNPRRPAMLQTGDYSYGIYLYGFPVQQVVAQLGPWAHHWAVNLLLSFPLVAVIAALSWHGIEKHALKLRRYLPTVEHALSANAFARLSRFKAPVIGDRAA